MAQIQAISVGRAVDVDSVGYGAVHSVFPHAVNLLIRGDLWTLLAESKADLPFGIRLALADLNSLGLHSGDLVHIRAGFVGIGSHLVVDCRAAPAWIPTYEAKPKPGLTYRLEIVARAASSKSWCNSASMAQDVRIALRDAVDLGDVLAKVVGHGPGLTPSGDDVLVGVLAVLKSPYSGVEGPRAAESLGRALLPLLPTTTDLSGHLLRQATTGLFGRDVYELVSALIGASSLRQVSETAHRVIETGATSGADLCEGLLAFAPAYFVSPHERASA